MKSQVISTAPGRVCLLGDKSDLLGRPVIAAAISKFFEFKFKPINEPIVKFNFPKKNLTFERNFHANESDDFFKFFSQITYRLKDRIKPFECTVDGDLPIGSGLSSSAACSIGFISGLNKLFGLNLNHHEIAEFAYQVEHEDLGIMCGRMDQYSIAYGGVTFIQTDNQTKVTNLQKVSLPLVIGDSCEPRRAATVLNSTMELLRNNDPHYRACFDIIHKNVINGLSDIQNGDLAALGARMCVHQAMERSMGASTAKLDKMCDLAIRAGALGAKQIGAGGSGCMIALCPDKGEETERIMEKVMEAVRSVGANVWKANIHHEHIE
ncbi:hypothetical protein TRFO_33090 [Tritrichomonas foetus]|uniref:mevalonate kinase n=1 Tax=Tritrichomonas foetus TaxID=1144522 RepID=A0A1J4JRV0_9EUKA|nr:hypothetical protein TRFO_33090 [Tritrichomonas foetus]|eukprot:OHT00262.1 hypothetical protein TRFO_33090 [Tritrichomonas foetus]